MQQIVLVSQQGENSNLKVFDIQTGQLINIFKQCSSSTNSMCLVGDENLACIQTNKQCVNFYTWYRESPLYRCFTAEKLTTISASPGGTIFAGGGQSGTIYIWLTCTGQLIRTFSAHYRPVVSLKFTDFGSFLVSAGEDTVVSVWSLMDVLDLVAIQQNNFAIPNAFISWSNHTQAITDLVVGSGEINTLICSASNDRSVSIFSISSKSPLCKLTFGSEVSCLALDQMEHYLFVGTKKGQIFCVELNSAENPTINLFNQQQINSQVTCLSLSMDGFKIVSGFKDGQVVVWDILTKQKFKELIKASSIENDNNNTTSTTNVMVLYRPSQLSNTGVRDQPGVKKQSTQKIAMLQKYPSQYYDDPSIILSQQSNINAVDNEEVLEYFQLTEGKNEKLFQSGTNSCSQGTHELTSEWYEIFKEMSQPYMQDMRNQIVEQEDPDK